MLSHIPQHWLCFVRRLFDSSQRGLLGPDEGICSVKCPSSFSVWQHLKQKSSLRPPWHLRGNYTHDISLPRAGCRLNSFCGDPRPTSVTRKPDDGEHQWFLSVLWHCRLVGRKGIRPVKNLCWHSHSGGDLTGALHDFSLHNCHFQYRMLH